MGNCARWGKQREIVLQSLWEWSTSSYQLGIYEGRRKGGSDDEESLKELSNRYPIYMGGYQISKESNHFVWYGVGYEIDELDGICVCVCNG